jgi:hypothetical protein
MPLAGAAKPKPLRPRTTCSGPGLLAAMARADGLLGLLKLLGIAELLE